MTVLLLQIEFGNWQRWDIIIGAIAASLLLIVILIQVWTTWQAKKAAEAAQISATASVEANCRAQEEMDIRLRAFIGIGHPEIRSQVSGSDRVEICVPIKNYGKTPANKMDLFARAGENHESLWEEINESKILGSNAIFPDQAYPLICKMTADEKTAMTAGTMTIYVAIRAYYSDYMNHDWVVESLYECLLDKTKPSQVGVPTLVSNLLSDNPARIAYQRANAQPTSDSADTESLAEA